MRVVASCYAELKLNGVLIPSLNIGMPFPDLDDNLRHAIASYLVWQGSFGIIARYWVECTHEFTPADTVWKIQ